VELSPFFILELKGDNSTKREITPISKREVTPI
jgi:hypothetical protein